MALLVTRTDPQDVTQVTTAYLWFTSSYFNWKTGQRTYTVEIHRSAEAAASGKPPMLGPYTVVVPPEGIPEIKHIDHWDTPPVLDENGNEITPGISPHWVIDQAADPGLMALVLANPEVFGAVRKVFYDILKDMPENAGAVEVD